MENNRTFSERTKENIFSDHETLKINVVSNEKIRLVDKDEETNLELYCYIKCQNDEEEFVKECRGLVFSGNDLIMKAFPYTYEYSHDDKEIIDKKLEKISDFKFFKSFEGALIRMFFFENRWYISTHRKLNAFKSKWATKESFGSIFQKALVKEIKISENFRKKLFETQFESDLLFKNDLIEIMNKETKDNSFENFILERFQEILDKKKQYMFLLRNIKENRIVCNPPTENESQLLHVGTFINGNLILDENVGIKHPENISFNNTQELYQYIELNIDPFQNQGIVCFGPNNNQIKILHKNYLNLTKIRGNEPSIKFRYLQVRSNKILADSLIELYPEYKLILEEYEKIILNIADFIHKAYIKRFINKNYIVVPQEEYQVMKACHSWHLSNKQKNKISLEKVILFLNEQSPTNINHMIQHYKIQQKS